MKITDIRSMALVGPDPHGIGGQSRNWPVLIVRVDTDEGLYGLGEATNTIFMGIRDALAHVRRALIGQDPMNVRPIYSDLVYGALPPHVRPQPPNSVTVGPIVWAMSGVEMALLDLVGKALKTPVYNLLGGKFRDRIRIYLDRSTPENLDDLNAWRELAIEAKERGFTDMKFDLDYTATDHTTDVWNRSIPLPQLNKMVERIGAVRDAVGWDMEVSVDCHMHYDVPSAIRLANALAPLRLKWFEDPTPLMNPDAMAKVRDRSPIPICTGEMFTAEQFRLFIDRGACDIIHPDVLFTGGLHETRKIADYAELNYLPMAMHNNGAGLGTIAAAHVAAATRNFIGLEYHFHDAPWIGQVVDRGMPLFEDGHVRLTDAPGLGVVLNEDVCGRQLAEGEKLLK
jgi:galactonate dehydratase